MHGKGEWYRGRNIEPNQRAREGVVIVRMIASQIGKERVIARHGDSRRRGKGQDWTGKCSRLARMRGLGLSTCGESSDGLMEVRGLLDRLIAARSAKQRILMGQAGSEDRRLFGPL